jgi:hypothetical protein
MDYRGFARGCQFRPKESLNRVLLSLHERGTSPTVREGSQREARKGTLPYGRASAPDASTSNSDTTPTELACTMTAVID